MYESRSEAFDPDCTLESSRELLKNAIGQSDSYPHHWLTPQNMSSAFCKMQGRTFSFYIVFPRNNGSSYAETVFPFLT